MPQSYSVNVMDEHVLRGNAAIVRCHIPSFVIDFVFVSAWILDDNNDKIEIHADHNNIDIERIGIPIHFSSFLVRFCFSFQLLIRNTNCCSWLTYAILYIKCAKLKATYSHKIPIIFSTMIFLSIFAIRQQTSSSPSHPFSREFGFHNVSANNKKTRQYNWSEHCIY